MPSRTSTPLPSANLPAAKATPLLPSPQTFDILPKLHHLLSRLLPTSQTNYQNLTPLQAKDLETQASEIRILIQKARVAVEGLPDIERNLREQEVEIGSLEERRVKLRELLVLLGQKVADDA